MSPTLTIKPGLLIALRSTVTGGVSYSRRDLLVDDASMPAQEGAAASKWETTRVIQDPEEFTRAGKARSAAVALVRGVCVATSFGLLCPSDREEALGQAFEKARAIQVEFNASANYTRFDLHMMRGCIAASDEQAVRTINAELAGLVGELTNGIDKLDPKAIRDAADRARQLAAMLSPEREKVVSEAVAAARAAAREIVKRVEKKGEDASIVLRDIRRGALEVARITFLDMEDSAPTGEALPAVNVQRFDGLADDDAHEVSEFEGPPEPVRMVGVERFESMAL